MSKHHAMNTLEGLKTKKFQAFSILVLQVNGQFHTPTALPQRKKSKIPCLQKAVGPIVSMDSVAKIKIMNPTSHYWLSYHTWLYCWHSVWCLKLLCDNASLFMDRSGLAASTCEQLLHKFTNTWFYPYFKSQKFLLYWKIRNRVNFFNNTVITFIQNKQFA